MIVQIRVRKNFWAMVGTKGGLDTPTHTLAGNLFHFTFRNKFLNIERVGTQQ